MRIHTATLATVALLVGVIAATATAQPATGAVRGEVTDKSGGVLPGVTVVVAAPDGKVLANADTDGSGAYFFRSLPAGPITLTFQLQGFATAAVSLAVEAGYEARVTEHLDLAPISETVVVHAPPPPAYLLEPPSAPIPPAPTLASRVVPIPAHDPASVCGPAKPDALPESLGKIRSARSETLAFYNAGSELVIDKGRLDGLGIGQNLVVRRNYRARGAAGADLVGEHSAGLVQIVAADERSAVAVVVYACDEMRKGDFLASFKPELLIAPDAVGTPAFYDAARILFPDEGQMLGAPRRMMVIDRGADHGVHAGQRFTLFRQGVNGRRDVVGDAVVVAVRASSATIRVDRVSDAIMAGDWAAPQTASAAARQHQ